ncbi:hypothetical protein [Luteibacter yeojuensis]|uniref:Uncharacterized protein n=1 Tax=Luteibacter yeojuensis TaxID=345309 RepID=A0A0F3KJ46_9GAMM|nr:hypothetical protein [Luteibacter yeojuensis]KJV31285.1 hypothetical protein VI08_13575 [Luteibacter yeojuensis]
MGARGACAAFRNRLNLGVGGVTYVLADGMNQDQSMSLYHEIGRRMRGAPCALGRAYEAYFIEPTMWDNLPPSNHALATVTFATLTPAGAQPTDVSDTAPVCPARRYPAMASETSGCAKPGATASNMPVAWSMVPIEG